MTYPLVPIVARRRRGERFLEGDVYVGRPSRWGNPFRIGDTVWVSEREVRETSLTRVEAIDKYREWIAQHPELIAELAARNPVRLLCWCAPEPCHADVLAAMLCVQP